MPNSTSGGGDEGDDAGSEGGAAEGEDDSLAHQDEQADSKTAVIDPALIGVGVGASGSQRGTPIPDSAIGLTLPSRSTPQPMLAIGRPGTIGVDEEVEGDDELLPAMADDDYSAQLSWQSQSKDNLKCVSRLLLMSTLSYYMLGS